MALGTSTKGGKGHVSSFVVCPALKGVAAPSEDGHWEDWPVLRTNRDLFSVVYWMCLTKNTVFV